MNQIKAILGATSFRTGVIVGTMLLLASGKSLGHGDQAIADGAHICTVASIDEDQSNGDEFLLLRNSCHHDVAVNYRYMNREGCQMERVVLPEKGPATPFRKANNSRVCIEYSDREDQRASGYEFCGDRPTRCAAANKHEVIDDLKYDPDARLVLSTEALNVPEGQRGVFGVSLSHRPTEPVQIAISHPEDTDISLNRYFFILDEASWSQPTQISVGTIQDDDDTNDVIIVRIDASGGGYSDLDRDIQITIIDDDNVLPVPPGVVPGTDPENLAVKATVYAIPPVTAPDQATVRIHCRDESESCAVFLDCTAQDGSNIKGWYLSRIPARGTHSLGARDIIGITGENWTGAGQGRLACDIRSEMDIVAQVWTRSGEDILINNSAAILSRWTNDDSVRSAYLNECLDGVREEMDGALMSAFPLARDRMSEIDKEIRECRTEITIDGLCGEVARCDGIVEAVNRLEYLSDDEKTMRIEEAACALSSNADGCKRDAKTKSDNATEDLKTAEMALDTAETALMAAEAALKAKVEQCAMSDDCKDQTGDEKQMCVDGCAATKRKDVATNEDIVARRTREKEMAESEQMMAANEYDMCIPDAIANGSVIEKMRYRVVDGKLVRDDKGKLVVASGDSTEKLTETYSMQREMCMESPALACSKIDRCEADARTITDFNIRYVADTGYLPTPDGSDISNVRIRCSAPDGEHCTFTQLTCTEDDGTVLDTVGLGTIERHNVRHIQAEELADLLDHRWQEMSLSCQVKSDRPFSVQILTRTGGDALVNNSAGL